MHKPSFDELDAIARKNGWYTRDNHPPLPFFAIVGDDDDVLKEADDSGAIRRSWGIEHRPVMLVHTVHQEQLSEHTRTRRDGSFNGYLFARPYKGPVNGVELNTIHVESVRGPIEVPAQVVEPSHPGLKSFVRGLLR